MRIYGTELRCVALRALESGGRRREVAQTLGVSIPTLDRWRREFRQGGQEAPRPRGHKKRAFSSEQLLLLKSVVQASPDATVKEHLRTWRERSGQGASDSSVRRALKQLGWSFKKRVFEPANEMRTSA